MRVESRPLSGDRRSLARVESRPLSEGRSSLARVESRSLSGDRRSLARVESRPLSGGSLISRPGRVATTLGGIAHLLPSLLSRVAAGENSPALQRRELPQTKSSESRRCLCHSSISPVAVVQKRTETSRGAAKFVSPARQRWVKWTKKRERQRRGTAMTQTPQGRHEHSPAGAAEPSPARKCRVKWQKKTESR